MTIGIRHVWHRVMTMFIKEGAAVDSGQGMLTDVDFCSGNDGSSFCETISDKTLIDGDKPAIAVSGAGVARWLVQRRQQTPAQCDPFLFMAMYNQPLNGIGMNMPSRI
ncbi:hypothetical protein EC988_002248 [Linderina pennispora]|nr:hypothetical protein EC988_002248 [Linderina pennispora]